LKKEKGEKKAGNDEIVTIEGEKTSKRRKTTKGKTKMKEKKSVTQIKQKKKT
jgi:hypothetical protein